MIVRHRASTENFFSFAHDAVAVMCVDIKLFI